MAEINNAASDYYKMMCVKVKASGYSTRDKHGAVVVCTEQKFIGR